MTTTPNDDHNTTLSLLSQTYDEYGRPTRKVHVEVEMGDWSTFTEVGMHFFDFLSAVYGYRITPQQLADRMAAEYGDE